MKASILKALLAAGLLLAAPLALQAQDDEEQVDSLTQVRQKGVLRVAVYKDFPPYSFEAKGRMQGLDVEIAKALAEKLDLGMSTMNLTASDESMEDDLRNAIWKGHYLGGGTADVMMHVPVDPEFAEDNDQVTIFAPYFQEQLAVALDQETIPSLDSLMIFMRHPVAVELETLPDLYLTMAERGRVRDNVRRFRHISDACKAFIDGEVPAFMAPLAQLENCVKDNERFEIESIPMRGRLAWTVGMAVKADKPELIEALDRAMEELRRDGGLEAIFRRHGISYILPAKG